MSEETPALTLSRVSEALERDGLDGLVRLSPGPFLIEVRTQDPSHRAGEEVPRATLATQAGTVEYDEELLLELRRVRTEGDTRVIPLVPGAAIGRDRTCVVRLAGSDSVSKRHAHFTCEDGKWALSDLDSTNGTFVDRQRLAKPAPLAGPHLVQTGAHRFLFVEARDLDVLLRPVSKPEPQPVEGMLAELEGLGSRRFLLRHQSPYLVFAWAEGGADAVPRVALPLVGDGPLTLGRTREATVTIPEKSVSKNHARLERAGSGWSIEDSGSSYGTTVNGERLSPGTRRRLVPWDGIVLASKTQAVFLEARSLLEYLAERRSSAR